MYARLTLKLNRHTVERAKEYALDHNRSLSSIIEDYLTALTNRDSNDNEFQISPFVLDMSSGKSIPADLDSKTEYSNRLIEKYR